MTSEIRHEFKEGIELNQAERERLNQRLARPTKTFQEIIGDARQWEADHQPFDRTSRLNLFQYVIEEGTGGALVPLAEAIQDGVQRNQPIPTVYLQEHAHGQLLDRLEYAKKNFDRLPTKFNIMAVNWLIQEYYEKGVMIRLQDGNQARALMSDQFEPFDDLELLEVLEPYCQNAEVKWYHSDERTIHVTATWPTTEEVIRVGDVVQRGIHISNSEVGLRSVTIAGLVHIMKCSNTAIGAGDGGGMRRFRHVGDSDKLRDQVKAAVEATYLESTKIIAQFKASLEKAIDDPYNYLERVAKDKTNDMTQEQFKASLDAFMLEPEPNLYGVTNAITRAAQGFDGEERYEMECLGGKVLTEGLRK